jgi:hypothetical protein
MNEGRGPKTQAEVEKMNADPQRYINEMRLDLLGGGWSPSFGGTVWTDLLGRSYHGPYKAWTIWAGVEMKQP